MNEFDKRITHKTDKFFKEFATKKYAKGEILMLGGDNPPGIFYLVRGLVAQYHLTATGQKVVLNIFKPHAFFPASLALNGSIPRYFFEAAEDITVRIAPPDKLLAYLTTNEDVLLDLTSRLYKGMDGLLDRIVELMSGSAKSRLIIELLIEVRRFSHMDKNGVSEISISTVELALRTGLSRETGSRELKKIESEKLILKQNKTITILNVNLLEKALEH